MRGFTLIELIIILVVIGILAATATPLFVGSGGAESQAVRARAAAVLRNIQLFAMNNTDQPCVVAVIDQQRLGQPTSGDCNSGFSLSSNAPEQSNRLVDSNTVTISLGGSSLPAVISFDALGRPGQACNGGCQLSFDDGNRSRDLCIEAEGYIHSCP